MSRPRTTDAGRRERRAAAPVARRFAPRVIDAAGPAAVDNRAVVAPDAIPPGPWIGTAPAASMDTEHFGNYLRHARELRALSLGDVAQKTKVARSVLELLERGDIDSLPSPVYARGFIRSFARAVGADETEPLLMFERALEVRSAAERRRSTTPVPDPPRDDSRGVSADDETLTPRRNLGLAVFVIILLLIATITLSLLLRRPPPSGEGLSLGGAPSSAWSSSSDGPHWRL